MIHLVLGRVGQGLARQAHLGPAERLGRVAPADSLEHEEHVRPVHPGALHPRGARRLAFLAQPHEVHLGQQRGLGVEAVHAHLAGDPVRPPDGAERDEPLRGEHGSLGPTRGSRARRACAGARSWPPRACAWPAPCARRGR
ncbi:MAG: hypothetical protein M5U28_41095 [Sandaracinaceae bacterium]|nr:hypothetical protein [Sandaracinaceae bacterium]